MSEDFDLGEQGDGNDKPFEDELFNTLDIGEDEETPQEVREEEGEYAPTKENSISKVLPTKQNSEPEKITADDEFELESEEEDSRFDSDDYDDDFEEVEPEEFLTKIFKTSEKKQLPKIVKPKTNPVINTKERILKLYGVNSKPKGYGNRSTKTTTLLKVTHPQPKTREEISGETAVLIRKLRDQIAFQEKTIMELREEVRTAKHDLVVSTKGAKLIASEASNVPQLYAEIESLRNQLRKSKLEKKKIEEAVTTQHEELAKLYETNKKLKEYIKKRGIQKRVENPEDLRRRLNEKVSEMDSLLNKVAVLQKVREQNTDKVSRFQIQVKELEKQLTFAQEKIQYYENHRIVTTKKATVVKLAPISNPQIETKENTTTKSSNGSKNSSQKLNTSLKMEVPSPQVHSVKLAPVVAPSPLPTKIQDPPKAPAPLIISPRPKVSKPEPEKDFYDYSNNSPITVNREEPFISSPRSLEPEKLDKDTSSSSIPKDSSIPFKPSWSANNNSSQSSPFPGFSFQRQKKPWEK